MRILVGLFLSVAFTFVEATGLINISEPWSRMTARSVNVGGVFANFINNSRQDDVLISASSSRAQSVQMHESIHDNGMMRMREVKGGIALPKGQVVELKPGGLHIMLIGIKTPLKVNDQFDLRLNFKNAKSQIVTVKVNNGVGMINRSSQSEHTIRRAENKI